MLLISSTGSGFGGSGSGKIGKGSGYGLGKFPCSILLMRSLSASF
jgi:hypothetical protein